MSRERRSSTAGSGSILRSRNVQRVGFKHFWSIGVLERPLARFLPSAVGLCIPFREHEAAPPRGPYNNFTRPLYNLIIILPLKSPVH